MYGTKVIEVVSRSEEGCVKKGRAEEKWSRSERLFVMDWKIKSADDLCKDMWAIARALSEVLCVQPLAKYTQSALARLVRGRF